MNIERCVSHPCVVRGPCKSNTNPHTLAGVDPESSPNNQRVLRIKTIPSHAKTFVTLFLDTWIRCHLSGACQRRSTPTKRNELTALFLFGNCWVVELGFFTIGWGTFRNVVTFPLVGLFESREGWWHAAGWSSRKSWQNVCMSTWCPSCLKYDESFLSLFLLGSRCFSCGTFHQQMRKLQGSSPINQQSKLTAPCTTPSEHCRGQETLRTTLRRQTLSKHCCWLLFLICHVWFDCLTSTG